MHTILSDICKGIDCKIERLKESQIISTDLKAKIIVVVMGILALVSPYLFSYRYDSFDGIYVLEMSSLTWIHYSNVIPPIIFHLPLLINNPINTLLRFWFVFEMYQSYMEKSSRRRAISVGVLSELWQSSIMTYYLIFWRTLVFVPIPLLLIVGIVFLTLMKPSEPPGLWEEKDT